VVLYVHRKIGILGGMSPESTVTYYEYITRTYTERHGDLGYPEVLIYSVSFQEYVDWQRAGEWDLAAEHMAAALQRLRAAGADFGLIATNTMHIVFEEVQRHVRMPLLSIVDVTAEAIETAGLKTVGLLGTVFTMRRKFFKEGLGAHGIGVRTPNEADQDLVNTIIYDELCHGRIRDESRARLLGVIGKLRDSGAEGVVLGCTELPLLVSPDDCDTPLFNTTILHAEKALQFAVAPVES